MSGLGEPTSPYRILIEEALAQQNVIGTGGFSQILSVRSRPDVVVKFTKKGTTSSDAVELALEGARSEASILAQLQSHPNVIGLYFADEVQRSTMSGFCMVLEAQVLSLATLISLHQFVIPPAAPGTSSPLSFSERLKIMAGVWNGLLHVHSCGFMHGDVTSANVMLNPPKETFVPKLIDFGFTCRKDPAERSENQSMSGQSRMFSRAAGGGTPGYISDETTNQPAT